MTSFRGGILDKLSPFVTCSCETTSFAAEAMLDAALTVPVTSSSARLDSAMNDPFTYNAEYKSSHGDANISYGQWRRMPPKRGRPVW